MNNTINRPPARGVAALPIVLMLSLVAMLAVVHAHRDVIFDLRSTANQARAAQAHEAAQAGLAWAIALLNRPEPIDEACRPSDDAASRAWQERTRPAAPPLTLHASCIANDFGWSCHCPASGDARPVFDAGQPAFHVSLAPEPGEADRWQLTSVGHSGDGGAPILLRQDIGRLPGPDTLPAAALTVRRAAHFPDGHFTVNNMAAAGSGLTVHAGAEISGAALTVVGAPGTPAAATVLADDPLLAGLSPEALHASLFRLDRPAWREQPGVHEVDCRTPCDTALQDASRRHTMLHLAGGLRLSGATTVGTPERPVLLVVDGPVELQGGATLHGLVVALHPGWHDTSGSRVQGAVVALEAFDAHGFTRIDHDAPLLRRLQSRAGTFAPRLGSWRDL